MGEQAHDRRVHERWAHFRFSVIGQLSDRAAPLPSSLDERISAALADAASPIPFAELRSKCRVRAASLYERLAALTANGRIAKTGDGGYRLVG
jgi:hypothetical protein